MKFKETEYSIYGAASDVAALTHYILIDVFKTHIKLLDLYFKLKNLDYATCKKNKKTLVKK